MRLRPHSFRSRLTRSSRIRGRRSRSVEGGGTTMGGAPASSNSFERNESWGRASRIKPSGIPAARGLSLRLRYAAVRHTCVPTAPSEVASMTVHALSVRTIARLSASPRRLVHKASDDAAEASDVCSGWAANSSGTSCSGTCPVWRSQSRYDVTRFTGHPTLR